MSSRTPSASRRDRVARSAPSPDRGHTPRRRSAAGEPVDSRSRCPRGADRNTPKVRQILRVQYIDTIFLAVLPLAIYASCEGLDRMKIAVVGSGYVGLVAGACLAE